MNTQVQEFLSTFDPHVPTPIEKARHWLKVMRSPQDFYPGADKFELAHRRRNARQNVRRLLARYPMLISALKHEATA